MLKRLSRCIVVLALVFAIGGHWAVLQSIAWVGMTINFSKTDRLDVAIEKTFDGQHPCHLCKFVAEGKKSERAQEIQKPATKLDFISATLFALPGPPEQPFDFATFSSIHHSWSHSPPSPPPRAV